MGKHIAKKDLLLLDFGTKPKIKPEIKAVRVNPGKNGPKGNKSAPIKSARAPQTPPYKGPKSMAHAIMGIKLKLRLKFCILIPKKRFITTAITQSKAVKQSLKMFFRFIKRKPPPRIVAVGKRQKPKP